MSTIAEIEAAIEKLPEPQVDELAVWLEKLRVPFLPSPREIPWWN